MESVMKTVQAYIDSKQHEFMNHPFFNILEELNSIEEISYFVPELTFWAMTFQDILRINEERVTDPYLKKVARHHRLEDAGHEKWFLSDKNTWVKYVITRPVIAMMLPGYTVRIPNWYVMLPILLCLKFIK